ncbi:hypothetical protein WA026_007862 [Henosepilachna vigintioctopunctata]|uniref:Carboxylesterase type B domain-containing protein n=1 Tax=Henosepilachna vigintioctopunctata TaxID=420089 RepID=A0AAW1TYW7_9CUCU
MIKVSPNSYSCNCSSFVVWFTQRKTCFITQGSLVTGSFSINGCPSRRISQRYVIGTPTKNGFSNVKLPENLNDEYFRKEREKRSKKEEGDILQSKKMGYDKILAEFQRFFAPVVEKPSKNAFISEEPEHILKSGNYNKVPIIIATNSNEAAFHRGMRIGEGSRWSFDCKLEIPVDLRKKLSEKEESEVVEKIYNFYKLPAEVSEEKSFRKNEPLQKYFSCSFSLDLSPVHVSGNKVRYRFHEKDVDENCLLRGFRKDFWELPWRRIELFIWYLSFRQMEPNSSEENTMKRLVKLWTNFAKHNNPTPENNEDDSGISWIPIEQNKHHYLDIADELTMKMNLFSERNKFWNDIYNEYSKKLN